MTAKDRGRRGACGDEAGDPVCWVHRLCPECGAMPTAGMPDRCWRCGNPTHDDVAGLNPAADDA